MATLRVIVGSIGSFESLFIWENHSLDCPSHSKIQHLELNDDIQKSLFEIKRKNGYNSINI